MCYYTVCRRCRQLIVAIVLWFHSSNAALLCLQERARMTALFSIYEIAFGETDQQQQQCRAYVRRMEIRSI